MASRIIELSRPLDLSLTLRGLAHGRRDPSMRFDGRNDVWRAVRTPDGPATEHIVVVSDRVEIEAWGPGADRLLGMAPDLLGEHDDPGSFSPQHPRLRELHRRSPGLRIGRSCGVVEVMIRTILEQKIPGASARESFRKLVYRFGEKAPGPRGLWLQPDPAAMARLPYYELHPLGIERKRAIVLKQVCTSASRLERLIHADISEAKRALESIPGIGPWTVAITSGLALGDTDAVEVGDYHLAHNVAWVLAGEPRATDERMLELLEPYRGQRTRAIRLIEARGPRAPRFGPRLSLAAIDSI
ncbi:MAG: DNA-3-methyladenine glycosylase 2 family protein [Actinomycetota bacterium]|nr:DNA-3-methyladenine glycosylase 2 family protein [Actinomycetota bacterium]